jgi:hypothetical protein
VENRVKTGPKPWNVGTIVVRVRARWEKKRTQSPSRRPPSRATSVTKGAATMYQSVAVGRKDIDYKNRENGQERKRKRNLRSL